MIYIYTISCPLTKHVVYVGKTNCPEIRRCQHFSNSSGSLIGTWCKAMISIGIKPEFDIVFKFKETGCCDCMVESKYIDKYKLQNMANFNKTVKYFKPVNIRPYIELQDLKSIEAIKMTISPFKD